MKFQTEGYAEEVKGVGLMCSINLKVNLKMRYIKNIKIIFFFLLFPISPSYYPATCIEGPHDYTSGMRCYVQSKHTQPKGAAWLDNYVGEGFMGLFGK
jgi:hypothetical protein